MAQNLKADEMTSQDALVQHFDRDGMKVCLRKADEIRGRLEGRKHTDSTELIAEDRKR